MDNPALDPQVPGRIAAVGASAAGFGFWYSVEMLLRYGPSWTVLPPLGFAVASLWGAHTSWARARQEMRHRDELHRVQLERARAGLPTARPEVEALPPR